MNNILGKGYDVFLTNIFISDFEDLWQKKNQFYITVIFSVWVWLLVFYWFDIITEVLLNKAILFTLLCIIDIRGQ